LLVLVPKATRGFEPISYREALLSTLPHAVVYVFLHNLLNVLQICIADKMGLQKKLIATDSDLAIASQKLQKQPSLNEKPLKTGEQKIVKSNLSTAHSF
jgi:hypothetical protein